MGRCLLKDELSDFITEASSGIFAQNSWASISFSWELEIVGLNYLLIQILLSDDQDLDSTNKIISDYFDLNLEIPCWFTQEEFDYEFVGLMLKQVRDKSISLEEDVVAIRERMSNYNYDRTVR